MPVAESRVPKRRMVADERLPRASRAVGSCPGDCLCLPSSPPAKVPFSPIPYRPLLHPSLRSRRPPRCSASTHPSSLMSAPWPPASDAPEGRSGASTPEEYPAQPRTPLTSTFESPLLSPESRDQSFSSRQSRTQSALGNGFVSSPLNPNSPAAGIRSRPASRGSTYFNRIASEESQALSTPFGSLGQRGSMVLYRLASDDAANESLLPPKAFANSNRDSIASSSGDSVFSLSSDSRFPTGPPANRGFVPYAYDPELEKDAPDDDDDILHRADYGRDRRSYCSCRGIMNVSVLVILVGALLTLFAGYPLVDFYRNESRNLAITANTAVNASGQVPTANLAK